MKREITKWLALALAVTVFLAACGGPAPERPGSAAPPSSGGVSLSSAPEAGPGGESEAPEEEAPAPGSGPGGEEESPAAPPPAPDAEPAIGESEEPEDEEPELPEDGWYSTKDEVALYIHLYDHLPENYVTKKQAQKKGWQGGGVERYTGEGTAIGGDRFGNREGLLPSAQGRQYTECDIDTVGKDSRGAKRIVFSNDGLVYYTGDHYNTFELLYGEP